MYIDNNGNTDKKYAITKIKKINDRQLLLSIINPNNSQLFFNTRIYILTIPAEQEQKPDTEPKIQIQDLKTKNIQTIEKSNEEMSDTEHFLDNSDNLDNNNYQLDDDSKELKLMREDKWKHNMMDDEIQKQHNHGLDDDTEYRLEKMGPEGDTEEKEDGDDHSDYDNSDDDPLYQPIKEKQPNKSIQPIYTPTREKLSRDWEQIFSNGRLPRGFKNAREYFLQFESKNKMLIEENKRITKLLNECQDKLKKITQKYNIYKVRQKSMSNITTLYNKKYKELMNRN